MEAGEAAAPHSSAPGRFPPPAPSARLSTHRASCLVLRRHRLPQRPQAGQSPLGLLPPPPPPPPQARHSFPRDAVSVRCSRAARSVTDWLTDRPTDGPGGGGGGGAERERAVGGAASAPSRGRAESGRTRPRRRRRGWRPGGRQAGWLAPGRSLPPPAANHSLPAKAAAPAPPGRRPAACARRPRPLARAAHLPLRRRTAPKRGCPPCTAFPPRVPVNHLRNLWITEWMSEEGKYRCCPTHSSPFLGSRPGGLCPRALGHTDDLSRTYMQAPLCYSIQRPQQHIGRCFIRHFKYLCPCNLWDPFF